MVSIESAPGAGAGCHLITTDEAEFAFRLYHLARLTRIEPRFLAADRRFTLEFFATQNQLDVIVRAAQ